MNKNLFPIYGILAGLGLSYLYIKTLGKDKNLNLVNTLLIGGGIGAGLGSAATLISNMKKQESKITEESILSLAGDVNSIDEVKNYLLIIFII